MAKKINPKEVVMQVNEISKQLTTIARKRQVLMDQHDNLYREKMNLLKLLSTKDFEMFGSKIK